MSSQTATLIAASTAAFAALMTLLVNTVVATRREGREAQREALASELPALGEALHEVVATSETQRKAYVAEKQGSAANWLSRGTKAAKDLERLRLRVRYPLAGLDEGFRTLTRLPSWIAHLKESPKGETLSKRADELARVLHEAIETAWRKGKPPGKKQRRSVAKKVAALRAVAPIGEKLGESEELEARVGEHPSQVAPE